MPSTYGNLQINLLITCLLYGILAIVFDATIIRTAVPRSTIKFTLPDEASSERVDYAHGPY